ncbi:MAG: LamG domain-containing protein, partial [Akkermansiaceae bacterium]|nr:LamG domain-containing protein [Akkermansiaceae bacterium]
MGSYRYFSSPINTATIASLNGNTAANRRGVSGKISGISWAPGAELWVRVADGNESGNEQAMGIDDFYFIADNESGLAFNGSSSYVSMGFGATTASLNTSSFTVECRFMRTGPGVTASTGSGGVTTAIPLVAKGVGEADGTSVDANYFLGIDNATGRLCADFEQLNATNNGTAYAAGQNFPVFGSTVLQNGVFYHVAATYDTASATWKLYVNGVAEITTQTLPTFVGVVPRSDNTQGLGIGTTVNSTGARAGFFQGIIDEARIWNYARSATEINANKDVEIGSDPGLLGRYGFDEGTGTTAAGTLELYADGVAAPWNI